LQDMKGVHLLKCMQFYDLKKKIYKDMFDFKNVAEIVKQEISLYE